MKKKISVLLVVVLCLAACTTGTLAYFTGEEVVHNVITSGGVNISIIEQTRDDSGALVEFPKEGLTGIMPGSTIDKIVEIKNTGESDAWIRVKVESTIVDAAGKPLPLTFGQDKKEVMNYSVLDGWTLGDDGYYYYKESVAAGESTEKLLETVSFNSAMGNEYQNCTANIIISAQAVQKANNGSSVAEAKGWPKDQNQ